MHNNIDSKDPAVWAALLGGQIQSGTWTEQLSSVVVGPRVVVVVVLEDVVAEGDGLSELDFLLYTEEVVGPVDEEVVMEDVGVEIVEVVVALIVVLGVELDVLLVVGLFKILVVVMGLVAWLVAEVELVVVGDDDVVAGVSVWAEQQATHSGLLPSAGLVIVE